MHSEYPTTYCLLCEVSEAVARRGKKKKRKTPTQHITANSHFNTDYCHLMLPVQCVKYATRIIYPGAKLRMHGMPRATHLNLMLETVPPQDCSPTPHLKKKNPFFVKQFFFFPFKKATAAKLRNTPSERRPPQRPLQTPCLTAASSPPPALAPRRPRLPTHPPQPPQARLCARLHTHRFSLVPPPPAAHKAPAAGHSARRRTRPSSRCAAGSEGKEATEGREGGSRALHAPTLAFCRGLRRSWCTKGLRGGGPRSRLPATQHPRPRLLNFMAGHG